MLETAWNTGTHAAAGCKMPTAVRMRVKAGRVTYPPAATSAHSCRHTRRCRASERPTLPSAPINRATGRQSSATGSGARTAYNAKMSSQHQGFAKRRDGCVTRPWWSPGHAARCGPAAGIWCAVPVCAREGRRAARCGGDTQVEVDTWSRDFSNSLFGSDSTLRLQRQHSQHHTHEITRVGVHGHRVGRTNSAI